MFPLHHHRLSNLVCFFVCLLLCVCVCVCVCVCLNLNVKAHLSIIWLCKWNSSFRNIYISLTTSLLTKLPDQHCVLFIKTRVFQIVARGGEDSLSGWESETLLGRIFLPGEGNLRRSDFGDSNLFSIAFCEYWTSIKIKINMTCASKEYDIKTEMELEQRLQLKILFLLGYNLKIII